MGMRDPRPAPVAAIVGAVGGVLLVIGSFLTWARGSVDIGALARLLAARLKVDPATLLARMPTGNLSRSASGFDLDGEWALGAGIVIVALAVIVIARADFGKIGGGLMIVGGLVGGGVALYDVSRLNEAKDQALAGAGPALAAAGIDAGAVGGIIKLSAGIGIFVCVAGGIVALIGGVMLAAQRPAPTGAPGPPGGPPPIGTGFESSSAAMPPSPSAPVSSVPASPPASTEGPREPGTPAG
jgi:hypothetical protein